MRDTIASVLMSIAALIVAQGLNEYLNALARAV
jgi:hypothetical protein